MSFLKNIFGKKKSLYDEIKEIADPMIIRTYRGLAMQNNCAPTKKTSDREILTVYQKVLSAFRNAAAKKGEFIPANTCNYIVFHFLQVYELQGAAFFEEHIKYEIMKYEAFGLRDTYKGKEISLFGTFSK